MNAFSFSLWSSLTGWRPSFMFCFLLLVFIDWMKTFIRIQRSHFGLHQLNEELFSYSVILFWSSSTGWRPFIVLGYLISVFIDWMKTFYLIRRSYFGLHWPDEDLFSCSVFSFWSSSARCREPNHFYSRFHSISLCSCVKLVTSLHTLILSSSTHSLFPQTKKLLVNN